MSKIKKRVNSKTELKVAVVHNWLWSMRGAEKCLDTILEIYPKADLYALFGNLSENSQLSTNIRKRKVFFSFLQKLPGIKRYYRATFPFWGIAVEKWDFSSYDLVISSSASTVKGVITPIDTFHVSYMYSPMRYIWDQQHMYLANRGWLTRKLFAISAHMMRIWDVTSTSRIDYLISISDFVSERIFKYYRVKPSKVIYPPVEIDNFVESSINSKEEYYIMVSGFQENKGASVAIEYAKSSGIELILVGDGPTRKKLERNSRTHNNIKFTGWVEDSELHTIIQKARGLLFFGVEDFGLVPVESAALGTPVLAYGVGGALESVDEGVTGVFIDKLTVRSISKGLDTLNEIEWDRSKMRSFAEKFSTRRFKEEFGSTVEGLINSTVEQSKKME